MPLKLEPGRFYLSRAGDVWCCFRERTNPDHASRFCVQVESGRVEYFFEDGRYDADGKREHTLVVECDATGETVHRIALTPADLKKANEGLGRASRAPSAIATLRAALKPFTGREAWGGDYRAKWSDDDQDVEAARAALEATKEFE